MEVPRYARCEVSWKIQNLSSAILSRPTLPLIESQIFAINLKNPSWGFSASKWKLIANRNRSTLSLYLRSADKYGNDAAYKNYHNLQIKYEMKLKETYGGYLNKQSGTIDGMYYEKRLGKITSVSDLNKRNSWRVLNDKAIEIVVSFDMIEMRPETVTKVYLDTSLLSTSFETMYGSKKYSDYTLVTADGEEIPVHKNVLASRSQVFAAMIETMLKEGEEKKAVIDDIDSKALKEFLRFLYCGRVNEIETVATDLIYAAEKYGLKDLKPLCVKSLINTISMDSAIETFILSDLHGEKYLKKFTLDYIMWNYKDLKDHESWKKLTTDLYKEVLDFAATTDKSISCVRLVTSINIVPATPVLVQRAQQAQPAVVAAVQRVANAVQRLNIVLPNPNANAAPVANPNVNAAPRVANAAVP